MPNQIHIKAAAAGIFWIFTFSAAPTLSQTSISQPVIEDGALASIWDGGIGAFDEALGYETCRNDGGSGCPSVSWSWVTASGRGQVFRGSWSNNNQHAGIFFKADTAVDLSNYASGSVDFEARVTSGSSGLSVKIDCIYPCTSGDIHLQQALTTNWQNYSIPVSQLVNGGLNLYAIDTGLVFWPTNREAVNIELDNVRWRADNTDTSPPPSNDGWDLGSLTGPDSPTQYNGYRLAWADEFNGSQLNLSDWNFNIGNSGWGNNEWQFYQEANATIVDGHLVITAREEQRNGSDYTSARIKTEGNVSFTYGRVDIRAALPRGQGIWPALWALGDNFSDVGWPYSGEIDIMEMIGGSGKENTVHGTVHWNNGGLGAPYSHNYIGGAYYGQDFSAGFNVFSIIRTPTSIEWRVNDEPYYQFDIDDSATLAAFRKSFFLIFNIAVGGNWPGPPDNTTEFPQRMVVDYVRIFEPASDDGEGYTDDGGQGQPGEPPSGGGTEDPDTDQDGLSDREEEIYGTDPNRADSDGDGYGDGQEVASGTDPSDPFSNSTINNTGKLEVPARGQTLGGIGILSGWHCTADVITFRIDGGEDMLAASKTDRADTVEVCGDANNGFGLLFNFGLLASGQHTITVFADGKEFERLRFNTHQLSTGEFLTDVSAETVIEDFPRDGHSVTVRWDEALQNFRIVSETNPAAAGARYRTGH